MMMNPFPFGFPPVRKPYHNYNSPSPNFAKPPMPSEPHPKTQSSNFSSINVQNNLDKNLRSDNFIQKDDEYFEIFGLKLHFDDLLIIALLFFLYQEEVKDTYLYIALILLLLS